MKRIFKVTKEMIQGFAAACVVISGIINILVGILNVAAGLPVLGFIAVTLGIGLLVAFFSDDESGTETL